MKLYEIVKGDPTLSSRNLYRYSPVKRAHIVRITDDHAGPR